MRKSRVGARSSKINASCGGPFGIPDWRLRKVAEGNFMGNFNAANILHTVTVSLLSRHVVSVVAAWKNATEKLLQFRVMAG